MGRKKVQIPSWLRCFQHKCWCKIWIKFEMIKQSYTVKANFQHGKRAVTPTKQCRRMREKNQNNISTVTFSQQLHMQIWTTSEKKLQVMELKSIFHAQNGSNYVKNSRKKPQNNPNPYLLNSNVRVNVWSTRWTVRKHIKETNLGTAVRKMDGHMDRRAHGQTVPCTWCNKIVCSYMYRYM